MPGKKENVPQGILYSELASWFYLLTAPDEYREEAKFYAETLKNSARIPVKSVLEMGSGGGNNAFHMKNHFTMTLSDISSDMLQESKKINPECEHIQGDMRYLRLGRRFDAIFIHDAIDYILNEDELFKTFQTAFIHCKPGGTALFCPDYIKETFRENTETGGHDAGERGLRYLDWTCDVDKKGEGWVSHFVIILRDGDKVEYRTDEHHCGLFSKRVWKDLLVQAGFQELAVIPYPDVLKECITPVFAGVKLKE